MSPRRKKEASVAGESPDKSEQRKSSGTAEERDPRFAVFREPAAAADSGSRSTTGGTTGAATDTATAVFRTPHLADAASDTPAGGTARESDAEGAPRSGADPEDGVEAREGSSTGRTEGGTPAAASEASAGVSDAPAAASGASDDVSGSSAAASGAPDVDSGAEDADPGEQEVGGERVAASEKRASSSAEPAGDRAPGDGASAGGPGSASRPESGRAAGSESEPEAGSAPGRAVAGAASGGKPDAGTASDDARTASDDARTAPGSATDARTGPASEAGSGDHIGAGTGASTAPTDARLRAAVAAWVADDDGKDATAPPAATDEDGNRVNAEDSAARTDEAEDAKTDGAKTDGAKTGGAKSEGAKSEGVKAEGLEAAGAARVPKTRGEASVEAGAEARTSTEAGTGAKTKPEAGTGAKTKPAGKPGVQAKPGTKAKPEAEDASGSAESAESVGDDHGIDQPTTAFKALRPERVDQPTTALKLPPSPAKKPEPGPETPAGRTSTFVPLRSDDAKPASAPRRPGAALPPAAPTAAPDRTAGPGAPAGPAAGLTEAERTRQQPMPPKPPLDLLAELTNTPPPPETPVRTAVRRFKIWTPLVLLLLIIFAIAQAVRPLPEPVLSLTAKSSYAFEGGKPTLPWPDEGQGYMAATGLGTVDSFGEQKPVPIGSVAKAMTAYLVLKSHPMKKGEDGADVPVDAKAEQEGGLSSVGESTLDTVKAGDTLTEQEAIAAVMIPSANNIARLLARWEAGSEKAFVAKMNDTAEELGMENTTYTDPSGLDATTVSTAEDQVKLGQKLVEIPALMEITKLSSWTDPSGKTWRNYNTLVPYDGALGIKTGTTTKAGGNLLFAAHKMVGDTDQLIVGAVLGQHKPPIIDTVNAVSKEVMVATQGLLESRTIVKKGQVVGTVDDGFGHTTDVVAAEDVKAVGWPGLTVELELTDDGRTIPNSAAAGTRVGTMTIGEGASQVKVPVVLDSALSDPTFGEKLTRIS
ncbi:hypothetical protein AB0G71_06185 [Streptomyces sp. NPDC020403]|uniref:hypothetical protein n=1 Tax=unclassified Streptomyces TaxID=2593676 RepID=UPI0033E1A249